MDAALRTPPPALSDAEIGALLAEIWGLRAVPGASPLRLARLTSERDLNVRVEVPAAPGSAPVRYVLKLSNAAEPPPVTALQTAALRHVARRAPGLPVPQLVPPLVPPAATPATHGPADPDIARCGDSAARLFTWLDGVPQHQTAATPAQRRALATAHGALSRALADFIWEGPPPPPLAWDIQHAHDRVAELPAVEPPELRAQVAEALERFDRVAAPALPGLRRGYAHNDLNPYNVLVAGASGAEAATIAGLLDFGDLVHTPLACDVAVAAAYGPDREAVIEYVSAFHAIQPMTPAELRALPALVLARHATTLCITSVRARRHPENAPYILRNAPAARAGLSALLAEPAEALAATLLRACGYTP